MAQLVLSVGGAVIGGIVGGPQGAMWGWSLGSTLGGMIAGQPTQHFEGSRLADLKVTGVEYGQMIQYTLGHPRVPGQIWWASLKREIAHTESQGGGGKDMGGGGGAEVTTYTYDVDILYGLADNAIAGVRRIWWNGDLVYSVADDASSETIGASVNSDKWARLAVYTGAADQLPDPTYEAEVGVGNAPAYRGRGSILIEAMHLGQGGQIPQLTFELAPDEVSGESGTVTGNNSFGTLGYSGSYGTLPDWVASDVFVKNIDKFSCHGTHAVWIDIKGRIWGIGSNSFGELALTDGTYITTGYPNPRFSVDPVQIAPGNNWVKCWAGWNTTHALKADGTIWAVGLNSNGQLGTDPLGGTTMPNPYDGGLSQCITYSTVWTRSGDTNDWADIAAGVSVLALAVKLDGSLWRCGYPASFTPGGTRTWTRIGAGSDWLDASFCFCANGATIIKADGTMWFYGQVGDYGVAGNGEHGFENHAAPVQVGSDSDWLMAGGSCGGDVGPGSGGANLAIKRDGTLWACGDDSNHATGLNTGANVYTWTQVGTDADWVDVKCGNFTTLARKADGSVWHCGYLVGGASINSLTFAAQNLGPSAQIACGRNAVFSFSPPIYNGVAMGEITLSWAVTQLCRRAGLADSQFDVSGIDSITKPVRALVISQVSDTRATLEMLRSAYFFDITVTDKIYFVARGGAPAALIAYESLGITNGDEPGEPLALKQKTDIELPAQISVTYSNVDNDYQTDTQISDRLTTAVADTVSAQQLPLGFTAAEAKGIANTLALDLLVSLVGTQIELLGEYSRLQPTDVIEAAAADGSIFRLRLVKESDAYPGMKFDAVMDDPSILIDEGITSVDYTSQTEVAALAEAIAQLMDIPILRDTDNDAGFYVAAKGDGARYPGAAIYASQDNVDYTRKVNVEESAVMGECTSILGDWAGPRVFDEINSIDVDVGAGSLAGAPRDAILSGSVNAMLIGREIIQFAAAAQIVTSPPQAGLYRLGGLLRGCRGTEWAMTGHGASERCVLLRSAGLRRIGMQNFELGIARYYKAVTFGALVDLAAWQAFTNNAVGLKPFSPFDLRAARDSSSNIAFTWQRRSRLSVRMTGALGISAPLGEAVEAYEIDIYSDGAYAAKVRTIAAATAAASYSAADQSADGLTPGAAVFARVYQISGAVGRGYPLEATA